MREGDHSSSWVRSDREQGLGSFSKSQGKGDTFIPTQEQLDGERIGGGRNVGEGKRMREE